MDSYILSVMTHIFRRLRFLLLPGYRRRLSAQEACILKKVPTEIIDMIMEHLPLESAISFSLTCRALYLKHFPQTIVGRPDAGTALSRASKRVLLEWLEQDIPELYFCDGCFRLHQWRAARRRYYFRITCYIGLCGWKHRVMTNYVCLFRYDLSYTWARLVMNRHLYGALHDPPLEDMEWKQVSSDYGPVVVSKSWTAKIRPDNNNLYLHGTTVARSGWKKTGGGGPQALREFVELFKHDRLVCRHYRIDTIIQELSRPPGESSTSFHSAAGKKLWSCSVCFTDYRIRIDLKEHSSKWWWPIQANENWSIEFAVWINLGKCRSPDDLEWHNLVAPRYDKRFMRREGICAARAVYETWMEDEPDISSVVEVAGFSKRPWYY